MNAPNHPKNKMSRTTSPLDVAGIGSLVVDKIIRTPRILGPEEKIILTPFEDGSAVRTLQGGVILNHLAWARLLGLATGVFGKLPRDPDGLFLRRGMEALGIVQDLDPRAGSTAFSLICVAPNGDRAIYMNRGANGETSPADIRKRHRPFIRRARLVTTEISQLPLATVVAVLEEGRLAGAETVLDVDIPPSDAVPLLGTRADLERALKLATYLKPSQAAARELVGKSRPLAAAKTLRQRTGAKAVAITDGARGSAIAAEGFSQIIPAFPVKAIDTTGCGDAFLGGFLAGLRRGLPWSRIGRLANACGAACAERLGAFPLPDPAGARKRIAALFSSS